MNKSQLKAELKQINKQIDQKIIKGKSYKTLAVMHYNITRALKT